MYINYNRVNVSVRIMPESELARINIKIDEKVKDDLKLIALREKTTMTNIIVKEIEKYIEDNKELLK